MCCSQPACMTGKLSGPKYPNSDEFTHRACVCVCVYVCVRASARTSTAAGTAWGFIFMTLINILHSFALTKIITLMSLQIIPRRAVIKMDVRQITCCFLY